MGRLHLHLFMLTFFLCFFSHNLYSFEIRDVNGNVIQTGTMVRKLKDAYQAQRNLSATAQAEYYYERQTNDSPCTHCPEYLKLIREVNKIVEKSPPAKNDSISLRNESLIQLNRLKFMYYEVRAVEEDGNPHCLVYQHENPIRPDQVEQDELKLLAEEALSLPNVLGISYFPDGKDKEIRYYYRGVEGQRNILVEVIVYPDRTAVIRYHHYRPKDSIIDNLPNISASKSPNIIETSIFDGIKANTEITVSDEIKVTAETQAKIEDQSMRISVKSRAGKDWVRVDMNHKSLNNVELTTVIPVGWSLNEQGLKVDGGVTFGQNHEYKSENSSRHETQVLELALTDHNHEYLKTSMISKDEVDKIILSSRYSLGGMGKIRGSASSDSLGKKSMSVDHTIGDQTSSFTTRIGVSSNTARFYEIQSEKKIGKSQSMILTIRTDDNHETTVMYQYQLKLH